MKHLLPRTAKIALATAAGAGILLGGGGVAAAQSSTAAEGFSYQPYNSPSDFFSCKKNPTMVWCTH